MRVSPTASLCLTTLNCYGSDYFLPTLNRIPHDKLPKDWIPASCQELPGQELHLTMSVQTELAHHIMH